MANYNRPLSPGSKLRRGPAGPVPLGLPKKPSGKITKEDIKKIQPKGPMPGAMKKAPATGMKTTAKKAAAKPVVKVTPKTTTKAPANKPMGKLVGPAAVAELQRQVSPRGVKKSEAKQKQAIDKKYPGLYKKSK